VATAGATARTGTELVGIGRAASVVQRNGVLIALVAIVAFGAIRYEGFLDAYNIFSVLSFNSMFGLVALGMCFVIMTKGIDLSVGSVAALASVVAALLSPQGLVPALLAAVAAGTLVGLLNGAIIAHTRIQPFVVTLASLVGARGVALIFANNTSVPVSYESGFTYIGQGLFFDVPVPVIILAVAYLCGSLVLNLTPFGRHVLAIGGNEEAARLMGLRVNRISGSSALPPGQLGTPGGSGAAPVGCLNHRVGADGLT
jgi:ribose/xylose/arabinose/galactoside ABC-type transport system permease subunit